MDKNELEDKIKDDPFLCLNYALNILKGPFPLGEESISRNIECSRQYSEKVLKGRFYHAEDLHKGNYRVYYFTDNLRVIELENHINYDENFARCKLQLIKPFTDLCLESNLISEKLFRSYNLKNKAKRRFYYENKLLYSDIDQMERYRIYCCFVDERIFSFDYLFHLQNDRYRKRVILKHHKNKIGYRSTIIDG